MDSAKRIFVASVATETNTFSPLAIDIDAFRQTYYAPGEHPDTPTLCSGPHIACRRLLPPLGWTVIEGLATWAEPAGLVNRQTWEHLRDELLHELREAMPVDAVVLGLHGAMVAQGYDDCEGDLLERVRALVGAKVVIATSYDPHSHLTPRRQQNSDLIVAFKEFPHTDFYESAEVLVGLLIRTLRGEINPTMASFDCRMIEVFPTSQEPMRSFVDRLKHIEQDDPAVLSMSVIHGFMAGDVPEMGTRMLVITDNNPAKAQQLARELGMELFAMRGKTLPPLLTPAEGLRQALEYSAAPVVIADVWDNPGGGVAGDSTLLLHLLREQNVRDVALATIWDPIAVQLCAAAGEGAELQLRFGGKTSSNAGAPVDARVRVKKVVPNAVQSFGPSVVPLGNSVTIELDGIDVILNSNRCQAFEPDIFTNLGIDPLSKRLLIVKSTNHFHNGFSPIAARIIYVDAAAPYPSDPRTNDYRKLTRAIWPRIENPHARLDVA